MTLLKRYETKRADRVEVRVWRGSVMLTTIVVYDTTREQIEAHMLDYCGDGYLEKSGTHYNWIVT